MKIQQQNSYNPNMKALYFTKTAPVKDISLTRNINKWNGEVLTNNRTFFIDDNSAKLTSIMREAFFENSFIRNLSDKYETFVQYMGEKYDIQMGTFNSSAKIYITSQNKISNKIDTYTYLAKDKFSPEGARLKLLADIEENLCVENYFEDWKK